MKRGGGRERGREGGREGQRWVGSGVGSDFAAAVGADGDDDGAAPETIATRKNYCPNVKSPGEMERLTACASSKFAEKIAVDSAFQSGLASYNATRLDGSIVSPRT